MKATQVFGLTKVGFVVAFALANVLYEETALFLLWFKAHLV